MFANTSVSPLTVASEGGVVVKVKRQQRAVAPPAQRCAYIYTYTYMKMHIIGIYEYIYIYHSNTHPARRLPGAL